MLKLNLRNAFNSVRCEKLSKTWPKRFIPSYAVPTSLLWNDQIIQSEEGLQQGDQLCLLLFFLAINCHDQQLCSPQSMMYLDDVSVGGSFVDVLHDLDVIKRG